MLSVQENKNPDKEKLVKNSFVKKTLITIVGLSVLLNLWFLYHTLTHKDLVIDKYNLHPFISKRVFLEEPNDILINFVPLRASMREYVMSQGNKVGVYFEYLPSGVSIGVNDRETSRLASLSKVPLAMSVLKKVELGKLSLQQEVVLKKENIDPLFGSLWKSSPGTIFTVEELINYSLQESDNTAYNALFDLLTPVEILEVYENLDIEIDMVNKQPYVSPKSYSSIFRALYLSSFLSFEHSNYLLGILTKTKFSDKIPGGLPAEVQVAHKVGVFSRKDVQGEIFTDCGVVYLPKRPYILCVFVKSNEEDARLHRVMISKMVYSYLNGILGGR